MPLRFDSTGDSSFVQLDVIAYQADVKGWPPDNWLMVELDASDGHTSWHRLSSALEVADVRRLAQFFRDAAESRPLPRWGWCATESDIELAIRSGTPNEQHVVTVRLNCHFHRDYVGEPCFRDWLELPFALSNKDLMRLAADADEMVLRFPERRRMR